MDFSHNRKENPAKSLTGITIAVVLHVAVGYLVISGMGKQMIEKIKNPIETKLIEEVKPPPKDLPPPPPPPEIKTPPPPFIPPPEVVVAQQAPVNTITTVTNVQPATNVMPRAPIIQAPVDVAAKPAPPARTDPYFNINDCTKPEYPKSSHRNEEEGTVTIEFLIGADGRVKDSSIKKSSGFRDLDKAAVAALSACNKFRPGTENGKPVEARKLVAYEWKLE